MSDPLFGVGVNPRLLHVFDWVHVPLVLAPRARTQLRMEELARSHAAEAAHMCARGLVRLSETAAETAAAAPRKS